MKEAEDSRNPTLREALGTYRDRVSIFKKGHIQEKYRIGLYCRYPIADMRMRAITSVEIAQFRDDRLMEINQRTGKPLSPATVRLDLALLSDVFRIGKIEWGICDDNPVANVRKPKLPPGRDRRLTPREERLILRDCASRDKLQLAAIIQLALETCMRQGELLAMRWEFVNLKGRIVHLPQTKNGSKRDVPLTMLARDILAAQGVKASGRVFRYTNNGLKSSWKWMINKLGIEDLHFHDLRHEAISRLVERGVFDLMEVAAISGHRSLSMLKRYTHLRTTRLIKKLDAGSNKGKAAVLSHLVPYPAYVAAGAEGVELLFPDFDDRLYVKGPSLESTIIVAQDALLRRIMTLMRHGHPIPPPDHYVDTYNEEQIMHLDPLANCE
ncbi:MAG: site-specific integrase [Propionivibrio sp.]|nr:site-specific integrase [Propionivibrio sp.]